jgi:hypothetical protein
MTACAHCSIETDGSYRCDACTRTELAEATKAEAAGRKRTEGSYMPWRFDLLGPVLRGANGKQPDE